MLSLIFSICEKKNVFWQGQELTKSVILQSLPNQLIVTRNKFVLNLHIVQIHSCIAPPPPPPPSPLPFVPIAITRTHNVARRGLKLRLGRLQQFFVPTILAMIGRHLGISLSCILFSHLPLLGLTNMAADSFNLCGFHTTVCNYLIHSLYRDQQSSSSFHNVNIWSEKILRGREPEWLSIVPVVCGFAPYL